MELPSLTSPDRLLWLAPAVGLLWWLAQPPRPRQRLWTAHAAQWRLAMERARRSPPRFRAIRWLLATLACAMLGLAAAQPVSAGGDLPNRVVFLVDGSASAAAIGPDGVSAFDAAIRRVRHEAGMIPDHVDVQVVIARGRTIARWSGAAARAMIDAGEPGGELPADLSALASSVATQRTLVWSIGDGQPPSGTPPTAGLWIPVGRVGANAALVAVEFEDSWPLSRCKIRGRVVSHANVAMKGAVRVEGAVVASVDRQIELAPRAEVPIEIEADRIASGGRLRLTLACDGDALPADDVCEFDVPPLPQTRIAVLAEEEGLGFGAAAGKALAAAVGGSVVEAVPGNPVGFLIVEGGLGSMPVDPGPMVAFGQKRDGAEAWPSPLVVDWDRADPVWNGLDLSELEIAHALRNALPPGRTLLQGQLPDGSLAPLAVVEEGTRGKAYHFAFRLQDSNLGLLAAFPQMLLRCYEQSQPGQERVVMRTRELAASESDLSRIEPTSERSGARWAAQPADLSAWCAAIALALLALRSGVR